MAEENQVSEYLSKPNIGKSIGPVGRYPRILRELADVIAMPLLITFQLHGEVPKDWRKATPFFKKDKREDLGNYRPVSLILIPDDVTEQILETISRHMKDREIIISSQH